MAKKKRFGGKNKPAGTDAARVILGANNMLGNRTIVKGTEIKRLVPRMPAGIFALTYATGGGYPLWLMTRIKGPESGGKTSTTLNAVKMAGKICWNCRNIAAYCTCKGDPFLQKTLICNPEGIFDGEWANHAIGLDPDTYWVMEALDGGAYADVANEFLKSTDGGLVVIDSIANMIPPAALERGVGDEKIAAHALLIKDLSNKLTIRLSREKRKKHPCLIICTNQLRFKVGVMFGSPETESGGNALRYFISLGLRMQKLQSSKDSMNKKGDNVSRQKHGFTIDKERVWTITRTGEFQRFRENVYSKKKPDVLMHRKGTIHDDDILIDYLKKHNLVDTRDGVLVVTRTKQEFKTESGLARYLRSNEDLYYQLQIDVLNSIQMALIGGVQK